jgi:hypothetical protein
MSLGHVRVKESRAGTNGHGPADQLDSSAGMAALMVHDPEIMQGIGILRLARNQTMVATGRIGVAASLVMK